MPTATKTFLIKRISGTVAGYFTVSKSKVARECGNCGKGILAGKDAISFKPGSSNPATMCKKCSVKLANILLGLK